MSQSGCFVLERSLNEGGVDDAVLTMPVSPNHTYLENLVSHRCVDVDL